MPPARQTAQPAPTTPPTLMLFGAAAESGFSMGAARAAEEAGMAFQQSESLSDLTAYREKWEEAEKREKGEKTAAEKQTVLLLYADGEEDGAYLNEAAQLPAYAFCTEDGIGVLPEGMPGTVCAPGDSASLLLDAILAYPPYCAPVRMLGLMTHEDSPGALRWKAAVEAGAVMSRGIYSQTGRDTSPGDWLKKQLASLYPGTVDCVYGETAALALLAETALTEAGRGDIRIFCDEVTPELLARMEESTLLTAGAGIDEEEAGYACARSAIALLTGGPAEKRTVLTPTVHFGELRTNP